MTEASPNVVSTRRSAQSLQRLVAELAERVDTLVAELATANAGPPAHPGALLTVDQAAEQLGISRSYAFALIKQGALRSIKLGSARRVPRSAVDELVESLANCQQAA